MLTASFISEHNDCDGDGDGDDDDGDFLILLLQLILKLEIVDQWSTRIPPPHRRGWHCSKSQGNHFESDIADNR